MDVYEGVVLGNDAELYKISCVRFLFPGICFILNNKCHLTFCQIFMILTSPERLPSRYWCCRVKQLLYMLPNSSFIDSFSNVIQQFCFQTKELFNPEGQQINISASFED